MQDSGGVDLYFPIATSGHFMDPINRKIGDKTENTNYIEMALAQEDNLLISSQEW